jgi:hypothetical protein
MAPVRGIIVEPVSREIAQMKKIPGINTAIKS